MIESPRAAMRLGKLGAGLLQARIGTRRVADEAWSRALWQRKQATRFLSALRVKVETSGSFPAGGMIVCNHLGYLDVLAIASCAPCVFVSKSEVRQWPLVGPLLGASGTILAERGKPLSAARTAAQIRTALDAGLPVVLFPEGTSTDGSSVLPFKPTLLQAALDAAAPVTPAAIRYVAADGNVAQDVCYWGDHSFPTHLTRLASRRNVTARLTFGSPMIPPPDRKRAARELHAVVAELFDGSLPI